MSHGAGQLSQRIANYPDSARLKEADDVAVGVFDRDVTSYPGARTKTQRAPRISRKMPAGVCDNLTTMALQPAQRKIAPIEPP
jgi:hypothetical protein